MRQDYVQLLKSCLEYSEEPFNPKLVAVELCTHGHLSLTEVDELNNLQTSKEKALVLLHRMLPQKHDSALYAFVRSCCDYNYAIGKYLKERLSELPKDVNTPDGKKYYKSLVKEHLRNFHLHNCEVIRDNWRELLSTLQMTEAFVSPTLFELDGRVKVPLDTYLQVVLSKDTTSVGDRVVIVGDPGMGKSVIMNKIALDWANSDPSLTAAFDYVLFIPLRHVAPESTLKSVLVNIFEFHELAVFLHDQVLGNPESQKKVLFLFDGYDEFLAENCEDIEDIIFSRRCKQSTVVVSTRAAVLDQLPRNITRRYDVFGFLTEEQQTDFVMRQNVFPITDNAEVTKEMTKLFTWDSAVKFRSTPILLTVICSIGAEIKECLAKNVTLTLFQLMKSFRENLLTHYVMQQEKKNRCIPKEQAITAVGKEAFKQCIEAGILPQLMNTTAEFLDELSSIEESNIVAELVAERAGFLFERKIRSALSGAYVTKLEFSHPYFRDFFAAHYVGQQIQAGKLPASYCSNLDIHGAFSYFIAGFSPQYVEYLFASLTEKEHFVLPWIPQPEPVRYSMRLCHLNLSGYNREEDADTLLAVARACSLKSLRLCNFVLTNYRRVPCADTLNLSSVSLEQCTISYQLFMDICLNIQPIELTLNKCFIIVPTDDRQLVEDKENMQYVITAEKGFAQHNTVITNNATGEKTEQHGEVEPTTSISFGSQRRQSHIPKTFVVVQTNDNLRVWKFSFVVFCQAIEEITFRQSVRGITIGNLEDEELSPQGMLLEAERPLKEMDAFFPAVMEHQDAQFLRDMAPMVTSIEPIKQILFRNVIAHFTEALQKYNFDLKKIQALWLPGVTAVTKCLFSPNLCLAPDFYSSEKITTLTLRGNLNENVCAAIKHCIQNGKLANIENCDISCNQCVGANPEILVDSLSLLISLRALNIAHCHVTEQTAGALATVFKSLQQIETLDLAGNISAVMCDELLLTLARVENLRFLDISLVDINERQTIHVLEQLTGSQTNKLRSLVIGPNLNREYEISLPAFIAIINKLEHIELKNCTLASSTKQQLNTELVVVQSIEVNHFRDVMRVDPSSERELLEAMKANPQECIAMSQAVFDAVFQLDEHLILRFFKSQAEDLTTPESKSTRCLFGSVAAAVRSLHNPACHKNLTIAYAVWSYLSLATDNHPESVEQFCVAGGLETTMLYISALHPMLDDDAALHLLIPILCVLANSTDVPSFRTSIAKITDLCDALFEFLASWRQLPMELAYLSAHALSQISVQADAATSSLIQSTVCEIVQFWSAWSRLLIQPQSLEPYLVAIKDNTNAAVQYLACWRLANVLLTAGDHFFLILDKTPNRNTIEEALHSELTPNHCKVLLNMIHSRYEQRKLMRDQQQLPTTTTTTASLGVSQGKLVTYNSVGLSSQEGHGWSFWHKSDGNLALELD